MSEAPGYYYAGGRRINVQLDDSHVAVDSTRLPAGAEQAWARVVERSEPLLRGLVLVPRTAIASALLLDFDDAGAVHPVYRHGSVLLVALPELRVVIRSTQRARLMSLVERSRPPVVVSRDDGDTITLRPVSGRGADAVEAANHFFEAIHPQTSEPRFLRVAPVDEP
jgi:hypothetical protein